MWNRRNQTLAVVLAVQIVIAVFVFWPRSSASGNVGAPMLPNYKAADVVGLTITDRDGNELELARKDDAWVLPRRDDFPADGKQVTTLLEKMEKLRTNRLVTKTEASQKQLQVATNDFNRKIEVTMKDNAKHTVYVGTSAGGSTSHVRADDQVEVYLSSDLVSWDVNAQESSFIDASFFTVPQTTTVAITLQNPQGTFEFERPDGNSQWTMKGLADGETLNQDNVQSLLSQVTYVRMEGPLGKTKQDVYGMDKPQAVATLKTKDGAQEKTVTLTIGAKLEDTRKASSGSAPSYYYVASVSESPYYVRLTEFVADSLVKKTRDEFVIKASTPTPGASTTPAPATTPTNQ
jgi:hypothetical protein